MANTAVESETKMSAMGDILRNSFAPSDTDDLLAGLLSQLDDIPASRTKKLDETEILLDRLMSNGKTNGVDSQGPGTSPGN